MNYLIVVTYPTIRESSVHGFTYAADALAHLTAQRGAALEDAGPHGDPRPVAAFKCIHLQTIPETITVDITPEKLAEWAARETKANA